MPSELALDRVLARRAIEVFGRYDLVGRLGTGGMAEVFVARCGDLPGMQSLVALKRILPHLAEDEAFVSLFRREAQISLRLRHRAIARVFEVGRVGGAWFLAMELVAGESLAHVLRAERERARAVDARVVAWVGAEIALALHHAHALSDGESSFEVVHRDISPPNVLIGFDGAAKLIDFGVARCARLSDATRAGTVRGKLAYASPEQLESRPLDGRSDLFSLAAVLHEWVAGAPLFERDSDAATVNAVQALAIPPLPRAPRLGAVLSRALERDPTRRFATGEALAAALLDAVGGAPAAPERLVADHLATLFPDRKRRWQAITTALDVRAADVSRERPGSGGTAPGTPASVAGHPTRETTGAGARRRRRRRLEVAAAAMLVAAGVLVGWTRHDRADASRLVRAGARAAAPASRPAAAPPAPPVRSVDAEVASPPPAGEAPVAAHPLRSDGNPERVPGPSRDGLRSASRASSTHRARHHATPPANGVENARAGAGQPIVDELEPSPYKRRR